MVQETLCWRVNLGVRPQGFGIAAGMCGAESEVSGEAPLVCASLVAPGFVPRWRARAARRTTVGAKPRKSAAEAPIGNGGGAGEREGEQAEHAPAAQQE